MKIRHRLLWLLGSLGLVASLAVSWVSLEMLENAASDAMRLRVRAEVSLLASSLSHPSHPSHDAPEQLQAAAVDAGRQLGMRVTLIGEGGLVLADSSMERRQVEQMDDHRGRPEIVLAAAHGEGESFRRSGSTGVEYFYAARRIGPPDPAASMAPVAPLAYVRLAAPASALTAVSNRNVFLAFLMPFLAMFLFVSLIYRQARRSFRTLDDLVVAVENPRGGQYQLPYEGDDEIGDLAASTNRAFRRMGTRIVELERQQHLADSVLSEMREGLLVVDHAHRISLANPAFRRIFRLDSDPVGRLVAEVLRAPSVLRDLDAVLDGGEAVSESIFQAPDSGRSFELHVTSLGDPGSHSGALVLFFDITRLEALEGVRREFVANVSHELRTPLTSIKAFVETLLDDSNHDQENSREFLGIVRKHAGRMEELIDDLTDLSLIETGAIRLDAETVDAGEVAREVASLVTHRYPRSEVSIVPQLPPTFPVHADRRRLEQVLLNLVDNAVKFSPPGGEVRIRGEHRDGGVILAVEDDGIGIPPDSQEKVFRRFYRVDKARSRDVGGTGLGLAIVKHLVRLHGGNVRLESEAGRGSTFFVEFPDA